MDPEWSSCQNWADLTVCKEYADLFSACYDSMYAGDAGTEQCTIADGETLTQAFVRLGWLFCGGEDDGGAGGSAGSAGDSGMGGTDASGD